MAIAVSEKIKKRFDEWRQFLTEELAPCKSSMTFDQFIDALEVAAMNEKKRAAKRKELEKAGKWNEQLSNVFAVASVIAAIPTLGASAWVSLGAAFIGTVAGLFRAHQEKKAVPQVKQLLEMLCIDPELLSMINDEIENAYLESPDFQKELEGFIKIARANNKEDNMRDFSKHFVDWLNKKSIYSKSDRTNIVATEE